VNDPPHFSECDDISKADGDWSAKHSTEIGGLAEEGNYALRITASITFAAMTADEIV
jgi:hypothetical protein